MIYTVIRTPTGANTFDNGYEVLRHGLRYESAYSYGHSFHLSDPQHDYHVVPEPLPAGLQMPAYTFLGTGDG